MIGYRYGWPWLVTNLDLISKLFERLIQMHNPDN
jgi:hypothetical protein